MFGSSNAFGQSSNSNPLGIQTQSMFGQTNNTKPFGSQTGSSMFGCTSTGLFGAPQASSQTFGNSAPSFGCNSTFGHKSFGFSTPQSSTFGITTPQSLSAFGNSTFGASSSPVLGASSTSSFGSWSSPGFGTTPTPSFGSFGTAFGSGGSFSASSIPSFSFGSGGSFSASSTPSFTFGSSPAFAQSTSTFSTCFCSTQSPFRSQIPQASALMFEGQRVGSRVMPYAPKTEAEQSGGNQTAGKLLSISTMDVYKHKTHEELRWEDYQQGDKGGQLPAGGSRFLQPSFFSLSPATNSFAQNTPSILASTPAHCPTPAMSFSGNLNNSQSSPLFSSNPSLVQTSTNSVFEQNTNPAFSQINTFSTPSTGFANLFSSSPSLTTDKSPFCQTTPVGLTPAQPAQTSISFCFNNFYQTPIANPAGRTESFSEVPALAKSDVMQPILVTNPFGTLPALPQGRNSPSVQYGISNIPVVDKPSPVRISSLLTSRRLLQRRVKLPARKCRSRDDGPKVPFFSDEEDNSSSSRPDIEAILPKLRSSEYFTQPRIQELAAKERVKPGYCKRVRDFVVGRHGYGSIKFLGETDVCKLDLERLVQFNNREVIVYMDETQKPPVGQGLNKPAEVSLLNVKCMDKKSGKQVTEGSRMDKYKEILKRKAEEQGAQFVSYDALNGEWKFRVENFSTCWLGDEDNV